MDPTGSLGCSTGYPLRASHSELNTVFSLFLPCVETCIVYCSKHIAFVSTCLGHTISLRTVSGQRGQSPNISRFACLQRCPSTSRCGQCVHVRCGSEEPLSSIDVASRSRLPGIRHKR